jgi:hypothetical protein
VPSCEHDGPWPHRVCRHLVAAPNNFVQRFTGRGRELEFVCGACTDPADVLDVCAACFAAVTDWSWIGIAGAPEIVDAPRALAFTHATTTVGAPRFVALEPVRGGDRAIWIGVADDGALYRWDADRGDVRRLAQVPDDTLDLAQPVTLRLSHDATLAAVANRRGLRQAVIDLATGIPTLALVRDGYHPEHCDVSLAFLDRGGRSLLVHAPAWNRLDVVDARTGELLTARGPTAYTRGEERPAHYLDYFHCGLLVSPDGRFIADNGWVWHPVGSVEAWSVERWLTENVWESEDGPSKRRLAWREYYWDGPWCWMNDRELAVWGYGEDDQWLMPAVRIFDVVTDGERWFPGPRGDLVCDRVLVSIADDGLAVWDAGDGRRLARDPARPTHYHPDAKVFVARDGDRLVTSRLRGLDAAAPWCTPRVRDVAHAIARDRSYGELPVLGDALQLAGCDDRAMLAHCHAPGEHGDGCWVIDRLSDP